MTELSLRVDCLAGKVDTTMREGSKEDKAYDIPNNYLPHSLIFFKTKNALNQQSETPNS